MDGFETYGRLSSSPDFIQDIVACAIILGLLGLVSAFLCYSAFLVAQGRLREVAQLWAPVLRVTGSLIAGTVIAVFLGAITLAITASICLLIFQVWPSDAILVIGFFVYLVLAGYVFRLAASLWDAIKASSAGP